VCILFYGHEQSDFALLLRKNLRKHHKKQNKIYAAILVVALIFALSGCGGGDDSPLDAVRDTLNAAVGQGVHATVSEDADAPARDSTPKVLVDEAPGEKTFEGDGATVDYSNVKDGYIMIRYEGDNDHVKVQISAESNAGDPYTYDLDTNGEYQAFPLSQGDGSYNVGVYTNVSGDKYAVAASGDIDVKIEDEFSPYLRPSQYVNYDPDSKCVARAEELVQNSKTDIGAAEQIFLYVIEHVTYDNEKAATVQSGYLPNVDETLETGKGICFDFASLTTAMLRSQGIPSKLVVGYAGSAYHAWIAVYSKETGEFAAIIEFKGDAYNLADPTFTAAGSDADPNIVGDGASYNPLYYY
jgi:hypothetical protein